MGLYDEVINEAAAAAGSAHSRAQALRVVAAELCARAGQPHEERVRAVLGRVEGVARELEELDLELFIWDGDHLPLKKLLVQLDTVESMLVEVEREVQALKRSLSD